jgi:Xaa-Pro aminopeptidase
MGDPRADRVAAAARACGADWAILTSVDGVAYAAGHVPMIEAGPSPFAGGPSTAVVSAQDGAVAVLCNELERPAAEAGWATVVRTYESIGYREPAPLEDKQAACARALLRELGVGGTVAVQAGTFPVHLHEALGDEARTVPIDRALERARAVKTDAEVAALRRSAEVTAVGHRAALEAVRSGRSELAAFADIRLAMESHAGERLPVTGDLLTGVARTAGVMGWPGTRTIEAGDPVICDLAPRVAGYWGDSCNTLVVGEPSPGFRRLWETSKEALDVAGERLRPGITAGALDAAVRGVIDAAGLVNPLHIGHGIGTSSHEWPRIVPGNPAVIEPGMVLMIEPGAYDPRIGGVRLEWMFLVTDTGAEVLSPFEHVMQTRSAGTPASAAGAIAGQGGEA